MSYLKKKTLPPPKTLNSFFFEPIGKSTLLAQSYLARFQDARSCVQLADGTKVMGLDPTRMQKWTSSGSGSKLWTDIAERRNGIYEKLRVRKRKFFFFFFLPFIFSILYEAFMF